MSSFFKRALACEQRLTMTLRRACSQAKRAQNTESKATGFWHRQLRLFTNAAYDSFAAKPGGLPAVKIPPLIVTAGG